MCGRYLLSDPQAVYAELFGLNPPEGAGPRYNIAPTQEVPAVRVGPDTGERESVVLRWGLIPHWANDPDIGSRLINARSETAAKKPSFRDALRRRRCLLPADGFYEWRKSADGKQPWLLRLKGGGGFALAGLWESWRDGAGEVVESCTVLTTEPNEVVAQVHDRMPVIVSPRQFETWLDRGLRDPVALRPLCAPYGADAMEAFPVSRRVNSPANDDTACIERVTV